MATPVGQIIASYRQLRRQIHSGRPWSQEDLAVAIGTDKAHINRIERGRQKPSRDTLLRIFHTLDIPWDDEQELLLTAGYAPELRFPSEAELDSIIARAAQLLDDLPHPAILFDVIMRFWHCNRVGLAFLGGIAGVAADEITARCRGWCVLELFVDQRMESAVRRLVPEEFMRGYLARCRQIAGLWRHMPEHQATIARYLHHPGFVRLWQSTATAEGDPAFVDRLTTTFQHPRLGVLRLESRLSWFGTDSRFFITYLLPADEPTRLAFVRLLAQHHLPGRGG